MTFGTLIIKSSLSQCAKSNSSLNIERMKMIMNVNGADLVFMIGDEEKVQALVLNCISTAACPNSKNISLSISNCLIIILKS